MVVSQRMQKQAESSVANSAGTFSDQIDEALAQLKLSQLRFTLCMKEPLDMLPRYYGSMLRGGLGIRFKRLVCVQPQIDTCSACSLLHQCAFPAVFETPLPPDIPDAPHLQEVSPFMLAPVTEAKRLDAGERLSFDLTLFGNAIDYLPYFVISLRQLGEKGGLGRTRASYTLEDVIERTPGNMEQLVYTARTGTVNIRPTAAVLGDILPRLPGSVTGVRIDIQTPMRIRRQRKVTTTPDFVDFCRALLRRLSQLLIVPGRGIWQVDEASVLAAAKKIELVDQNLRVEKWKRYSSRQKQSIWMDGIVGEMELQGDLRPLLPLLLAGQWLRVGRGSTFGNGQYSVRITA